MSEKIKENCYYYCNDICSNRNICWEDAPCDFPDCSGYVEDSFYIKYKLQQLQEENEKLREALEEIEKDYCHKSNCYSCPAFDKDQIDFDINKYFNEDGEFIDKNGEFGEDFEGFQDSCRRSCKRGAYLAKQALESVGKQVNDERN